MVRPRKLLLSLFACAVAAPVGTFVATYPFSVVWISRDTWPERLVDSWFFTLGLAPVLSGVTFAAMVIIGLPYQAIMQKRGETDWLSHVGPPILGGCLISVMTMIGILYLPAAALNGFIAGSVFWLIRRPDKDLDEEAKA
ncbi:hypothetical protein ABAC460_08285 [Asticcacaulis sp. AC460]|uniref:hypothetical protein n=1 Tax=Asticcacaulis sp. AC460 TaxID=1282360 RepID=UPI0003C3ECCE|nr:hypothetical protein [Asticcacaulis sp. AC460]ESQ90817.1 hypothetical protein ABAC460_08285 [Asticcacaulis sp. AC460]